MREKNAVHERDAVRERGAVREKSAVQKRDAVQEQSTVYEQNTTQKQMTMHEQRTMHEQNASQMGAVRALERLLEATLFKCDAVPRAASQALLCAWSGLRDSLVEGEAVHAVVVGLLAPAACKRPDGGAHQRDAHPRDAHLRDAGLLLERSADFPLEGAGAVVFWRILLDALCRSYWAQQRHAKDAAATFHLLGALLAILEGPRAPHQRVERLIVGALSDILSAQEGSWHELHLPRLVELLGASSRARLAFVEHAPFAVRLYGPLAVALGREGALPDAAALQEAHLAALLILRHPCEQGAALAGHIITRCTRLAQASAEAARLSLPILTATLRALPNLLPAITEALVDASTRHAGEALFAAAMGDAIVQVTAISATVNLPICRKVKSVLS